MRRSRAVALVALGALGVAVALVLFGGLAPRALPALLQVGHLNRALPELTERDARALALDVTAPCTRLARLGHAGDGGWTVCLDDLAPPLCAGGGRDRIVYSFGVRDDWSFDQAAAAVGLLVFSFDPSVDPAAAPPNEPRIAFRPWALAATDHDPPVGSPAHSADPALWTRRTLPSIMDALGHTHVDVLKADIEWGEWEVLPTLAQTVLRDGRVGQLLLEIHLTHDVDENARLVGILQQLRDDAGLHVFHREDNVVWGEFVRVGRTGPVARCCHNVAWRRLV
jgi:hypothetical protein